MPKLWTETIETHRREVSDAILETTAALVAEHGLRSVTMSQIAEQTGIGRATLYKYFPGVEAILIAWHERQVAAHRSQLTEIASQTGEPAERLEGVLTAYALLVHQNHGTELAALMHQGAHIVHARRHLCSLIRDLLAEGAKAGAIRSDVPPAELATYCFHALAAASDLPSQTAVHRLMRVVMAAVTARA